MNRRATLYQTSHYIHTSVSAFKTISPAPLKLFTIAVVVAAYCNLMRHFTTYVSFSLLPLGHIERDDEILFVLHANVSDHSRRMLSRRRDLQHKH